MNPEEPVIHSKVASTVTGWSMYVGTMSLVTQISDASSEDGYMQCVGLTNSQDSFLNA
jgi:hypothetical protein